MTLTHKKWLALIAPCLLCACGASEDSAPPKQPMPVKDTVLGDMAGAMDKARGVEATTLQHKEDMDRALQEQEGVPPTPRP